MYHKLSDNLAITARVLEDVVRRFTTEERKRLQNTEELCVSHAPSNVDAADMAGGEETQLLSKDLQVKPQGGILDAELRKEKCQALQRVDEDMRCLQRIYTDLANTVDEQQQTFDSLESHMASAAADIERGREEISMGKYSWDNRMKQKIMYVVATVAGFCLVVGWLSSG